MTVKDKVGRRRYILLRTSDGAVPSARLITQTLGDIAWRQMRCDPPLAIIRIPHARYAEARAALSESQHLISIRSSGTIRTLREIAADLM